MAQIIQNKYPLDAQKRKAIGFGFPMDGNAVFIPTYQTRDQIKANLGSSVSRQKKFCSIGDQKGLVILQLT